MVKWLWVVKDESRFVLPLLLIGALLFSISSCKHNPVGPPPAADTTSNKFTWTQYTFGGQGGSSYFKDVATVNDSDIWAVGDIYTGTSDTAFYNAVHWDGKQWTLVRIPQNLYNFDCSLAGSAYGVLSAVFAFKDGNLIFTSGGDFILWNGASFTHLPCPNGAANSGVSRLWGASESDFYAVGQSGFIIHYSGGTWTPLPSGTSLPIQDIWGATNPKTGEEEILAVASNVLALPQGKKLLEISGNTVTAVSDSGLPLALSSVWFIPGWKYFIGGDGLYSSNAVGNSWESDTVINPSQYTFSIRGTGEDDIFMVGGYGLVSHWNGRTLRQYTELGSFYGNYYSVDFKGNMAVTVGIMPGPTINTEGVILMGTRR